MKFLLFSGMSFLMMSLGSPDPAPFELDGPYVQYKDNKVHVSYVVPGEDGAMKLTVDSSVSVTDKSKIELKVATDQPGVFFNVKLRDKITPEKSDVARAKKMLIFSDIEGEFGSMRKFLQANKVMDEQFKWTFGDGHLLLVGDFVDRGKQVTEVLWLIYSLEEQAKAAGGYVHYVLGNHEIMNLSGDLRYLNAKYQRTAQMMNKPFTALLGEDTELGQWFRSKNVALRAGDILLVHAGISPQIYNLDLDVNKVNKLTRPFFADSLYNYPNIETDLLMGDYGPFWYRGFYRKGEDGMKKSALEVDSSLMRFRAKHIVTGHTVIADTVSMLFNGKLFNTDTPHAKGKSEGLYIEGKEMWRVDASGNKFRLK
jgi:hypothetical protein